MLPSCHFVYAVDVAAATLSNEEGRENRWEKRTLVLLFQNV